MIRRWIGMLMLGAMVVGVAPAPPSSADEKRPPAKPDKLPADLDFVFESGCSFIALRPGELLDAAPMKLMPPRMKRELASLTEHTRQFLGIAITDFERVSVLMPASFESDPVFVARTMKPYDREAVLKSALGPDARQEKFRGLTVYTAKAREGISLCVIDNQTLAIGRIRGLKETIEQADGRKTPRPHAVAIEWAAAKHQVVVGTTPEPLLGLLMLRGSESSPPARAEPRPDPESRPRPDPFEKRDEKPRNPDPIKEKQASRAAVPVEEQFVALQPERFAERRPEPDLNEMMEQMPFGALPFKPLMTARTIAVAIDLGAESKARWQFTFADGDAASDGETAARVVLYVVRDLLGRMPRELRANPEAAPKLVASVKQLQMSLKASTVQRNGNTVEGALTLKTDEETLGVFIAELAQGEARVEAINNLKQIGLAMHNYSAVMGGPMPSAAICDKTGKPLLSWRVAILPYIEEDNLYKQFKLDEPWNSEHNIKLLDKMPMVYSVPGRVTKKGETFFCVFTGPNTPFVRPNVGPRMPNSFPDGTANTFLVVEAGESVPWTKPDDVVIDPKKPLPKLGGALPDRFLVAFADGSVRMISKKINEQVLRNLIDPADGNPIDWDEFEPKRFGPARPPREARDPEPTKPPPPPPEKKPEPR